MGSTTRSPWEEAEKDPASPSEEALSHTTSCTSTSTENTAATTPENDLVFSYRTIPVALCEISSIESLEAAFIKFEPFETWVCSFCGRTHEQCSVQAWQTSNVSALSTKGDFMKYLASQTAATKAVQESLLSYLLALEKDVPFSLAFNQDQRAKCNAMDRQLGLIQDRLQDLLKASELLKNHEIVPNGLKEACSHLGRLLGNCLGNARENHVCLKLNYRLALDV